VAHGAVAGIRVRGEEDVALLDRAVVGGLEAVNEAAELADDHLAVEVGDHREFVVLFANAGRHRRPEQHGIHLETRVQHRVLDDVERDGIDVDPLEGARLGLDYSGWHGLTPQSLGWPRLPG
jgi:hypothetical protein